MIELFGLTCRQSKIFPSDCNRVDGLTSCTVQHNSSPSHFWWRATRICTLPSTCIIAVLPCIPTAGVSVEVMQQRVAALTALVPDLAGRVAALDPAFLAAITSDLPGVAARVIDLKARLPSADVSSLLAGRPALLQADAYAELPAALAALQELHPGADIGQLLRQKPGLLPLGGGSGLGASGAGSAVNTL